MVLSNNRINETTTTTTLTGAQAPLAQTAPLAQNNLINKNINQAQVIPGASQTTVTTTSTVVPQQQNILKKDAVVTNVMEKPVIGNIIEKKEVEVHHKNVVQEIHEQKIIEIEKQNVIQNVNKGTLFEQQKAATRFEEIGTGAIGEQERLRLEQLRLAGAPVITQQQGAVRQVQEGEQVAQVVRQEFIERHVQPVITEVREQNIVQEVVHPVVRKIHEAPIIREVISTQPTMLQGTQFNQAHHWNNFHYHNYQLVRPVDMDDLRWGEYQRTYQSGFVRPSGLSDADWTERQRLHFSKFQTRPYGMSDAEWRERSQMHSGSQMGFYNYQLTRPTGMNDLQWGEHQRSYQQGLIRPSGLSDAEWTERQRLHHGKFQGTWNHSPFNMVTTTQTHNGLNTTTSTTGGNPLQAEMRNFTEHEHKVTALEGGRPTNAEVNNLAQHERVVDQVIKGGVAPNATLGHNAPLTTGAPMTTGAPLTTGAPVRHDNLAHQPYDDTTQKPGLMTRLKEKLHRNHEK